MSHRDQMELLNIYLNDHWAGAAVGANVANRMLRQNRNTSWAQDLAWLCDQIESDDRTLSDLRERMQMNGGRVKRRLAVVLERASRLKPNGRIIRYSPLSRVLEAEAMIAGVTGKKCLWATLRHGQPMSVDLHGYDFEDLERRADQQIEVLRAIHRQSAAAAFSIDPEGDV